MNAHAHVTEKLALFSGLPENARKELVRAARHCRFMKDESIFLHADPASSLFILARGAVRVHRQTPQGAEVTLHIAGPGDVLAGPEMFEGRSHYQASATAMMDSMLFTYPHRWVRSKMQEYPRFALNMLAAISRNASRAVIDKEHLSVLKAPQRVGCFLMQICDRQHVDPKHFFLPYGKATIASRLGMPPESLSRALAMLRDIGVSVKGNEICIADLGALDDYACGFCSVAWDCETRLRLQRRHSHK